MSLSRRLAPRTPTHLAWLALSGAAFLGLGCSSTSEPATSGGAEYLGLSTPERGFQVRSVGTDVGVGEDVEYCEIAQLPGDPSETYYVRSLELGNGTQSHHLIVTAATPGGPAEVKLAALGVGHRVPCVSAESAFGEMGFEGIGGSQQPYTAVDYPAGVGRKYQGGQYVVFDYHYLNTTDEAVEARSAFNFHLADASDIDTLAEGFAFSNLTIDTPPGESGSFTGECHFTADTMVSDVSRHTHRWGTTFSVAYAGGAREGQPIWTSEDWEHDVAHRFAEPVLMRAGEGLRFTCDYANETDHALRFGTSATDEMCILFAMSWAPPGGDTADRPAQGCQVTWVDPAGLGHPANEAGGFPAPSEGEVAACKAGQPAPLTACAECQCDACATPVIACAVDPECRAVLECFGSCTGDECANRCIDPHSSALGLLAQMQGCIGHRCTACDPVTSSSVTQ